MKVFPPNPLLYIILNVAKTIILDLSRLRLRIDATGNWRTCGIDGGGCEDSGGDGGVGWRSD